MKKILVNNLDEMENTLKENKAFTFDDFLLVPAFSYSYDEHINIASSFFDWDLKVPVLSSPMDTITGVKMMRAMWEAGGLGVHHRYCELYQLMTIAGMENGAIAVSPSFGIDNVKDLLDCDPKLMAVMDVAHGNTQRNLDFCEEMVNLGVNVVSGNICTWDAAQRYYDVGVKYMRVGIGAGSVCTTRLVTGVGVPQASAIADIAEYRDAENKDFKIISDGGHRNTGDIVKALSLGADFVMLGSMLSGTDEALGGTYYRGMASAGALATRKKEFFVEGTGRNVEPKGSVENVMKNIKDAIEKACYYLGVNNLRELKYTDKVMITPASYMESYSR